MKRGIFTVLMVLTATLLIAEGNVEKGDDSLEAIKAKGYITVGLDDAFPPMGFRDDAGNIVGFDIDLAKEAARRMGVEARFKPVEWSGIILSLNRKDIDLVWNGMTITEQRKAQIGFSKPYLENRQIIVVTTGSSIASKANLAGKTVGLQMGSSSENALAGDAATAASLKEVRKYANNVEALLDLAAGRTDAVVVDEIVGRYYIARKPGVYRVLAEDLGREAYGVGIRKADVAFNTELDRVLDAMKADGAAARISIEWFGEAIVK